MKKRIVLPIIAGIALMTVAATTYKSNFFEIAKQIEIFTDAYKQINMNYVDEVSPSELMDVAITAMFAHLDPYTHFWDAQEVAQARMKRSGRSTGIGAKIQPLKNSLLIKEVNHGQPADKAGLKAGDKLIKIGDIALDDFDSDAAELLKGAPGTVVHLTFLRQGKTKTTTLTRKKIPKHVVPYDKLIAGNIGYIKLTSFMGPASKEVGNALKELKSQGAQAIILDLRGNPGGLLSEAVNTSNLFLPKGQLIVYTKSIVKKYDQTFATRHDPVDTQIPVAVLVNAHSASASEIVAGSLQDLDRAVIIGSRSFGKGLVQRPKKLKYGAAMKLTISRYYTPSGRCIQALDYWHRDKNGNPVRHKPDEYQSFYTKNGRKVYDEGGIMPDVPVKTAEISSTTQALIDQNAFFNFATQYYYHHKVDSPEHFTFTDKNFNHFKAFLKKTDFHYQTKLEKGIQNAFKTTKDSTLKEEIKPAYKALRTKIDAVKTNELQRNKSQIKTRLTDEILTRYFYKKGFYDYSVKHNPVIQKAIEVLHNQHRYHQILSGK